MAEPTAAQMTNPNAGKGDANPSRAKPPVNRAKTPLEAAGGAIDIDAHTSADAQLSPDFTVDAARSLAAEVDRIRKMRKPFGAMGQKLALPERWGYKSHWFNDSPGRILQAEAAGWSFIKDPSKPGQNLSIIVGSTRNGQPLTGYAMEIPREIYDEDMAEKNRVAAEALGAVKAKPFRAKTGEAKASDRGKFYNPEEDQGHEPLRIQKG